MSTIYVSEPIHPQVLADIAAHSDLLLGFGPEAVTYESIADRVDAVMLRSERFPASRIAASARLKVIARHGAGYDTVDLCGGACPGNHGDVLPGWQRERGG